MDVFFFLLEVRLREDAFCASFFCFFETLFGLFLVLLLSVSFVLELFLVDADLSLDRVDFVILCSLHAF